MGRFRLQGTDALLLLQQALSNKAAALEAGEAQYTMIPNSDGVALDDAHLYRSVPEEYLLVVNASNRQRDWAHLSALSRRYPLVELTDLTAELAMLSLQGPAARDILAAILHSPADCRSRCATGWEALAHKFEAYRRILHRKPVKDAAIRLRRRFLQMRDCFTGSEASQHLEQLHALI
jgi:glycine cleavage system aminomethyltransferase T